MTFRAVQEHAGLEYLCLDGDRSLRDLSPLSQLPSLTTFVIFGCPAVQNLEPLRGLRLQKLYLHDLAKGMSLAPLAGMPALDHLTLGFPADVTRAGGIPAGPGLTALVFTAKSKDITLDGLERWPSLSLLAIMGDRQGTQLGRLRHPLHLENLNIEKQSALDLTTVQHHRELTSLTLHDCTMRSSLAPLRELPHLTRLTLRNCKGPINLAPLANLDHLTVYIHGTDATGREHFPPERLNPRE
ncbi:hypothetical protein ACWGPD_34080 [Streptomyces hirsutus]|uniref:hypothetical protein n=1 Tax=Streptomyces hirsutus TaxID=35620 RepID=UPI003645CD4C